MTNPDAVPSPVAPTFHAGEIQLHERVGVREAMERIGPKVIRDHMPDQHRGFFAKLPLMLVGSVDAAGRPWASPLCGPPGFLHSPDPRRLTVNASPLPGTPLAAHLRPGVPLGLLGIELETRRRNRLNATVTAVEPGAGFALSVDESFGNCPKYIQIRQHRAVPPPATPAEPVAFGPRLPDHAAALVRATDTAFLATAAPNAVGHDPRRGVDVSHRGGRPGFIRVTEEDGTTVLTLPDFAGNLHFRSFGNLALHPWAGLLVIDVATGDLLSLTGSAEVLWDGTDLAAFAGAERLLRLRLSEGLWLPGLLPLRWEAGVVPSPALDHTGQWPTL
ncbi:pyridoxamine 5'-phosphate oxidase family protein [Azospirillum griseum]|uniref:Flavin-nucleotide-binding protein n=1 Tax=Azospirillum griseum TaxID=2496639 RepID=A0A3S0KVM8_9PROT|nr:pyridoxamine 5'-phosphate oxidase family protein [Azospirillum griseum]RTR16413.1 flavin-nucleotide-binding protein [Azospirillum griseum]